VQSASAAVKTRHVNCKPLIGITPEAIVVERTDGRGCFCGLSYTQAVEQAGGVPLVMPLTRDTAVLDTCLRVCDGIILSGGGDASEAAGAYGRALSAAEQKTLGGVDATRDEMEIYLARQLTAADQPLLAICRGLQILNVALGGTLLPDVAGHRCPDPFALAHPVTWEPASRFAAFGLTGSTAVNTTHHQALDRIAPPLRVVARAADGIVEAAELPDSRFCLAVQFHPERLVTSLPAMRRLFEGFVAACARR